MEPHKDLQQKQEKRALAANDEIDLGPVINWVHRQLRKAGTGLALFFTGLVHFFWVLILWAAVGAGSAYIYYSLSRPIYFSDITLASYNLSIGYYKNFLLNLDLYLMDENYEGLAKVLDIPLEGAQQIKEVKLLDDPNSPDSLVAGKIFRVLVSVHDPSVYEYLGPKLRDYLGNNPFATQLHEVQMQRLKASVDALEKEIEQLDSLKRVVEKSLLESHSSGGLVFMESPDPIQVFEERNKLFQMQKDQQAKYMLSQNLIILDDFTPRTQPNEPQLLNLLEIAGWIVLVTGLVLTTVLEVVRRRKFREGSTRSAA